MLIRTLLLAAVAAAGCSSTEPKSEPRTASAVSTPSPAPAEAEAKTGRRDPDEAPEVLAAGLSDTGVFSDLDEQVTLRLPAWVPHDDAALLVDAERSVATLTLSGAPVKSYPLSGAVTALSLDALPVRKADRDELESVAPRLPIRKPSKKSRSPDADGDGIPDSVDAMLGARKAALNGAEYREGYEKLDYPSGDVDRDHGVCTDVVVRALRNAGLDLQKELYEDMTANHGRYGLGKKRSPDRNIEHRRVRRLLPFFKAHYVSLPADFDPEAKGRDAWLPGDIVFMETIASRKGPDHVGLVSDRVGEDGKPAIINNWTNGFSTTDLSLLSFVPITHRFRAGLTRK